MRQLKGESRTAAEVVMDDALVQDDGILDRCWEVTQDQDKASKIEKALYETQKNVKMETTFMSSVARRKLNFQQLEMHWERHHHQRSRVTRHCETLNLLKAATTW